MGKERFVYVTYMASTREKVWAALTEPEFTRTYWEHENLSDWKSGSSWEHRESATHELKLVGNVIQADAPKRLVLTWAAPSDRDNAAAHSRVTFELEQIGSMVRLTVVHDELEPGSKMLDGIRKGWPRVLSSLKTLLETGKPLQTWSGEE